MSYWQKFFKEHMGIDKKSPRQEMLERIQGKDPRDMTEVEYEFYMAEIKRKQDKIEREAIRMREEREKRIARRDRELGL